MKIIAILLSSLLVVCVFAGGYEHNYDPHRDSRGGCRNAGARYPDGDLESCAGIQLGQAGGFEPYENILEGTMQGFSPLFSIMLDQKGYLRQAKCPYGHFDLNDDPFFGSAVSSQIVGGVSRQFLGSNLRNENNMDAYGDWGNTSVRQRFLCPSAAYIKSPTHAFVCDNSNSDCGTDDTGQWDGSQQLLEASGFENSAECAREFIGNVFEETPVVVASNVELLSELEANPGTWGLLPANVAQERKTGGNPNLIISGDRIKCSTGYGYITRKDDEELCNCLTRAIKLVDPYDYAEVACKGRSVAAEDFFGPSYAEDYFNLAIDDATEVNDEGGLQLPSGFTFSDCGNYFCERPGDAACY